MIVVTILITATGVMGMLAVSVGKRDGRLGAVGQAALVGAATIWLVVYVAGDDHYRDDGTSRWEAYDVKELAVAAVATGVAAVVLLLGAAAARQRVAAVFGFSASVAAGVLQTTAVLANSLN